MHFLFRIVVRTNSNDNNEEKLLSQQQNTIDFFDEECRQNIYLWSAKRVKKEQKSYWYHLKIYVIDWALIKTFFDGITLMVALSMLLTCAFLLISV
ncbi:hypothetical protein HZS_3770 [Henneguya salminicola]|nr:hypothetical protein HZS_3770 [Henneguya salminicola]